MTKQILLAALFVILIIMQVSADVPQGWHIYTNSAKSYDVSIDKGAGQKGNDVPTIKSIYEYKHWKFFATLRQDSRCEKYLGKRVRMSGYIKSDNVLGWAGLWFRVDQSGSSTFLAFDDMGNRPIKGTTGWTKYDIVLDVSKNAFDLSYGGMLVGVGQIWMDNITFEIVDSSVKTTGITMDSYNNGNGPYLVDKPVNLNFDSLDKIEEKPFINPKQGWYKYGANTDDYSIGIDKGAGQNGTNAGFVKSIDNKANRFCALTQSFKADSYLNKRIKITGYIRSKDLKHKSFFYIGVYGPLNSKDGGMIHKILTYGNNYKNPIKGTRDWTKCEVVIDVPSNSVFINFGVQLYGGGEIWLDNVAIEAVDNSISPTTNWIYNKLNTMQTEPTNLNFSK